MFPRSSVAPKGRASPAPTTRGSVESLRRRGERGRLEKHGCVPLSKSLPALVLSFHLRKIGHDPLWASQSQRGLDSNACLPHPVGEPVPRVWEDGRPRGSGPAAATPLSARRAAL